MTELLRIRAGNSEPAVYPRDLVVDESWRGFLAESQVD